MPRRSLIPTFVIAWPGGRGDELVETCAMGELDGFPIVGRRRTGIIGLRKP